MNKWLLFGLLVFSCISLAVVLKVSQPKKLTTITLPSPTQSLSPKNTITSIPAPTPKTYKTIEHYLPPTISKAPAYTLIFVGDSMTESLE